MGAASAVDRALTAPRSVEEVYWDEARTAASDAGQPALPWGQFGTPKPPPEDSGSAIAERKKRGQRELQLILEGKSALCPFCLVKDL
jgi:hypothetical protein